MSFGFGMGFTRNDPFAGGPSLNLQFAGNTVLDPSITFTRALNTATYFDSAGLLTTANANVARFDYDPASPAGVTGGNLWSAATTFSAGTVTASGADVVFTGAASLVAASQPIASSNGKTFTVTFTVSDYVSGDVRFILYGNGAQVVGSTRSAAGTYTETVRLTTAGGSFTDQVRIQTLNGATLRVTGLSVQEVAFTPRGLLIEEARTNTLLQSRDMTQAAWGKIDVTPNRNQVGIDGVANTATLLTEGSVGTAITNQDGSAVTAGSTITASFVVKRGNTDWIRVGATGGGFTNGADGWFNLATGAKGSVTARGTGTSNSSTITNLGGGWYRCAVTTVPDATYTVPKAFIVSASANGSGTRVANSTYIVDCAQLEVGAFATSIIPTTTTTLTRNADVASITGANFSNWFNASAGSFVTDVADSLGAVPRSMSVYGASGNEQLAIGFDITRVRSGGVDIGSFYSSQSITGKRAVAYATNEQAAAKDGAALSSTNTGLPSGLASLWIGQTNTGAAILNGHIRLITYYPRRLSNAELQSITS